MNCLMLQDLYCLIIASVCRIRCEASISSFDILIVEIYQVRTATPVLKLLQYFFAVTLSLYNHD